MAHPASEVVDPEVARGFELKLGAATTCDERLLTLNYLFASPEACTSSKAHFGRDVAEMADKHRGAISDALGFTSRLGGALLTASLRSLVVGRTPPCRLHVFMSCRGFTSPWESPTTSCPDYLFKSPRGPVAG